MRYDRHDCIGTSLKQHWKYIKKLQDIYRKYIHTLQGFWSIYIVNYISKPRYSLIKSYLYIWLVGTTVRQKTDSL